MPQLKHLARFTTPVNLNNDVKDTPINTTNTSVNNAVYQVLTHSTQPLSVIEVAEAASRYAKRSYGEMQIRVELKALIEKRLISGRKESREEQLVRADNGRVPAILATLYWAPAGPVPARTVAEAVPGLKLFSDTGTVARKKYKYTTKKNVRNRVSSRDTVELVDISSVTTTPDNAVVDYLIEKMVAERTADLQRQLDDANARLKRLQELAAERLQDIFNS